MVPDQPDDYFRQRLFLIRAGKPDAPPDFDGDVGLDQPRSSAVGSYWYGTPGYFSPLAFCLHTGYAFLSSILGSMEDFFLSVNRAEEDFCMRSFYAVSGVYK